MVMRVTFLDDPRMRPRLSKVELDVLVEAIEYGPFFHVRNGWRRKGGEERRQNRTIDALRRHNLLRTTVVCNRTAVVVTDLGRQWWPDDPPANDKGRPSGTARR